VSKLDTAIRFAAERHEGQWRDGESPMPYITHPVEVLLNLRHVGKVTDEAILLAAVLHDLLEETSTTLEELAELFGERTAELVRQVTRDEPTEAEVAGLSKDEIYELRTARFLEEIKRMSPEAQMVKLADRLSNLRAAKLTRSEKRLKRYRAQTERILEIIPESVNPPLWRAVRAEIS
jgi:(p)ppGpp synthase/HD superfamily hydrolase